MEKALYLRLFDNSRVHPQWRSGYESSGQPEGTGVQILLWNFFFPFSFFFFFFVLFCFVCLFVLLFFVFVCF